MRVQPRYRCLNWAVSKVDTDATKASAVTAQMCDETKTVPDSTDHAVLGNRLTATSLNDANTTHTLRCTVWLGVGVPLRHGRQPSNDNMAIMSKFTLIAFGR